MLNNYAKQNIVDLQENNRFNVNSSINVKRRKGVGHLAAKQ